MPTLLRAIRVIDTFTDWSGKIFAFLVLPLTAGLVYEVFSRYLFRDPTVWAYDVTYMLYGTLFMLGAAFTLYRGGHIRTDIFYRTWSARRQGTVDAALYLFFFFPGIIFFLLAGWEYAERSWIAGELAAASPWRPPMYPFKTVIPVAAVLLLIQGTSEFLKSLYAAMTGEWPAEHHEEEAAT
jgi:TRAP-type mannitol/chloroaromatic compound transport system permease small subunit